MDSRNNSNRRKLTLSPALGLIWIVPPSQIGPPAAPKDVCSRPGLDALWTFSFSYDGFDSAVEVAGNSLLRRVDRQAREPNDAGASSCPASIPPFRGLCSRRFFALFFAILFLLRVFDFWWPPQGHPCNANRKWEIV